MKCIKINYNPKTCKSGVLVMPPSKSIAARRLLIDALSGSTPYDFTKYSVSQAAGSPKAICDDILRMERGLKGENGDTVNINASGTAMRLLTAFYAVNSGCQVTLTGIERMKQRPIKLLVDTLRSLGAEIEYLQQDGYPPLRITGKSLKGGKASIDGSVSSQYISALLLVAPAMEQGLELTLTGKIASEPYIAMTIEMMRRRGIDINRVGNVITVKAGEYTKNDTTPIEGDWSAAGFWYQYALASGKDITLEGLIIPSLQGDADTATLYEGIGIHSQVGDNRVCLVHSSQEKTQKYTENTTEITPETTTQKEADGDTKSVSEGNKKSDGDHSSNTYSNHPYSNHPYSNHPYSNHPYSNHPYSNIGDSNIGETTFEIVRDLGSMPDLVPSLATTLCLIGRTFCFSGIGNLRIKECDRLAVITSELAKLGYALSFDNDSLSWNGARIGIVDTPRIDPYNDHRMAMAMAFGAIRFPGGIIIENPDCVDKSYPSFWDDMLSMGFGIEEVNQ